MAILRSFRQEHKSENIVVQVLYSLQKLINAIEKPWDTIDSLKDVLKQLRPNIGKVNLVTMQSEDIKTTCPASVFIRYEKRISKNLTKSPLQIISEQFKTESV